MYIRYPAIMLIVGSAVLALVGCEHIQDPWVTGDGYFEEERQRSPELNDRLRERALQQAGR